MESKTESGVNESNCQIMVIRKKEGQSEELIQRYMSSRKARCWGEEDLLKVIDGSALKVVDMIDWSLKPPMFFS